MFFGPALFLFLFTCCDWIADGYKGIRSLHASKTAVEKLLGKGEVDDNGYYTYTTPDMFIRLDYSTEPCSAGQYGRGKFNIPADTVLIYRVLPKDMPLISEVEFDRDKFPRYSSEHLLNYAAYVIPDNSISIHTMIKEARDELMYEVEYRPTKEDLEKFKCK
jgi:hypothetical protein